MMKSPLVSSDWLQKNLLNPDLIILDASQQDNKAGLTATSGNLQIIGARTFDIKNAFSDTNSPFPNTLLSAKEFQEKCRELGINTTSQIVVYDNLGVYTSPRVWWMFKIMGFENISVLDGGLPDWISKGYQVQKPIKRTVQYGNFNAVFNSAKVRDIDDITKNVTSKAAFVIDARSANRFNGITPEPRAGLRSGHIPNSINIPYTDVLSNGTYKSVQELKEVLQPISESNRPIIFSCGSGVTACVVLLACVLLDLKNDKSIYDGSWTEWAQLTR